MASDFDRPAKRRRVGPGSFAPSIRFNQPSNISAEQQNDFWTTHSLFACQGPEDVNGRAFVPLSGLELGSDHLERSKLSKGSLC